MWNLFAFTTGTSALCSWSRAQVIYGHGVLFVYTYWPLRSMWHKPSSKSNIPQPDGDYQPMDTAANNLDSVCKAGNKLNSMTTRTPSSVYSMRARASVASSAMTDLGFFDSMIMYWVYILFRNYSFKNSVFSLIFEAQILRKLAWITLRKCCFGTGSDDEDESESDEDGGSDTEDESNAEGNAYVDEDHDNDDDDEEYEDDGGDSDSSDDHFNDLGAIIYESDDQEAEYEQDLMLVLDLTLLSSSSLVFYTLPVICGDLERIVLRKVNSRSWIIQLGFLGGVPLLSLLESRLFISLLFSSTRHKLF